MFRGGTSPPSTGRGAASTTCFRRWQRNGTRHRILTRLRTLADTKGAITWDLSVDSTACRAHPHATGARKQGDLRKEPPGGVFTEPRDHGPGRSRGGSTTKPHPAVEQGQKPPSIVVTAGRRSPRRDPGGGGSSSGGTLPRVRGWSWCPSGGCSPPDEGTTR
ncbi:hypothetical protein GCM10010266_40110 [Streptomyces griseomycini]|nr:hypothetical protein GCM10010266_40110 [Streptomyces griseomycini]GGR23009.1 hypothetical protein GCM10015536_30760 [Streptomyces griseomycini]